MLSSDSLKNDYLKNNNFQTKKISDFNSLRKNSTLISSYIVFELAICLSSKVLIYA